MAATSWHPALVTALEIGSFEVAQDYRPYVTFASGSQANNKFTADLALEAGQPPEVRAAVVQPMAELVVGAPFRPRPSRRTVLFGIPSGGQSYAEAIGAELGLDVVHLSKQTNEPGVKRYSPATDFDAELLAAADDAIGVEDAGNEWTSLEGAIRGSAEFGLGALATKTRGVAIFLQRGRPEVTRSLGAPVRALTYKAIPNIIKPDDRFLQQTMPWVRWRQPTA